MRTPPPLHALFLRFRTAGGSERFKKGKSIPRRLLVVD
jgi:hypothetical protein